MKLHSGYKVKKTYDARAILCQLMNLPTNTTSTDVGCALKRWHETTRLSFLYDIADEEYFFVGMYVGTMRTGEDFSIPVSNLQGSSLLHSLLLMGVKETDVSPFTLYVTAE